ncbi:2772_t:CDS:2, partial [Cetraspora pellucida]
MSKSEFTCQDFEKCINSKKNNKNSFTVASEENSQDDFTVTSEENSQDGFTVTSEENSQDGFTFDDVALAKAFASNDDYDYEKDNNYKNSDEDVNEVAKLISEFKVQDKYELFKGASRINEE